MNAMKWEYKMSAFDEANVDYLVSSLGLDPNRYFIAMTKSSMLSRALIGNIVDFANRYAIVCFSETELNLIMLSRLDNKQVTELIKINRNEITSTKFSNVLISYSLKLKTQDSTMRFQVFKKVGKFTKIKSALELFKQGI